MVDKNPRTISVWLFLLQASRQDILSLPDIIPGDDLRKFGLSDAERALIGYHASVGDDQNTNIVSKFNRWKPGKYYIANNLFKVKHWKVICGDYSVLNNTRATWFIDPPYFTNGKNYQHSLLPDQYLLLGEWCRQRVGQVIVCEEDGATWLPFQELVKSKVQRHRTTTEVVFLQDN